MAGSYRRDHRRSFHRVEDSGAYGDVSRLRLENEALRQFLLEAFTEPVIDADGTVAAEVLAQAATLVEERFREDPATRAVLREAIRDAQESAQMDQ